VLAGVDIGVDGLVRLTSIRDWTYGVDTILARSYFDATFDPADIVDMWMYEQVLDERGLIAHTFLVFEFDPAYSERRNLGISVETRREVGETYSLVGGVLRAFEMTHIWATEQDLVTRRVQFLDYPLRRYRLDMPAGSPARIFVKLARETQDLATEPRWYNTVTNNCTSSLIRYANESRPKSIPLHYSWVLTGKVDEHLAELGYLDEGSSLLVDRAYLQSHPVR
jgi:hypothetical protein